MPCCLCCSCGGPRRCGRARCGFQVDACLMAPCGLQCGDRGCLDHFDLHHCSSDCPLSMARALQARQQLPPASAGTAVRAGCHCMKALHCWWQLLGWQQLPLCLRGDFTRIGNLAQRRCAAQTIPVLNNTVCLIIAAICTVTCNQFNARGSARK